MTCLPIYSDTYRDDSAFPMLFERTQSGGDSIVYIALHSTLKKLNDLRGFQANWDGRGSVPPTSEKIAQARELIEAMHRALAEVGETWKTPHVAASEEGDVVMEWWRNDRKLTVYVGGAQPEFFQVWGPNIEDEMRDGAMTPRQFADLWDWLME